MNLPTPDPAERAALIDRLNAEELPSLAAFLGGYLHEDWQLEFASPGEAAYAFAGDADIDDVEELAEDWSVLLAASRVLDLGELNRLLGERFNAAWQVTSKLEIAAVEQELARALRE